MTSNMSIALIIYVNTFADSHSLRTLRLSQSRRRLVFLRFEPPRGDCFWVFSQAQGFLYRPEQRNKKIFMFFPFELNFLSDRDII